MAPISDLFLTNLANCLGAAAVLLIVVFQFVEISAKREQEALVNGHSAPVVAVE